jgi:hypothetical protein
MNLTLESGIERHLCRFTVGRGKTSDVEEIFVWTIIQIRERRCL